MRDVEYELDENKTQFQRTLAGQSSLIAMCDRFLLTTITLDALFARNRLYETTQRLY